MSTVLSTTDVVIDPYDPEIKPLREIGKGLPGRPSYMCLWRWMSKGIGGIHLPVIRIARKPYTTPEAVRVFLNETR